MSDPITPALTAEEWASGTRYVLVPGTDVWEGIVRANSDVLNVDANVNEGVAFRGNERHALAALALHGQPFGVTHEMADAIDKAQKGEPLHETDREWMRTAVRVILALLPTRGGDAHMLDVSDGEVR